MNDVISTRKMPIENMRHSQVFPGIFLVEMVSFMFLSQYRDKIYFPFVWSSNNQGSLKFSWCHWCLCTMRENEAYPIRACAGHVILYIYIYIYIYIHTSICTNIFSLICIKMYIPVFVDMYVYMYTKGWMNAVVNCYWIFSFCFSTNEKKMLFKKITVLQQKK